LTRDTGAHVAEDKVENLVEYSTRETYIYLFNPTETRDRCFGFD